MHDTEQQTREECLRTAAARIAARLLDAGHQAWYVGGCVRDALLDRPLKDIDIVTDARPEQVEQLFEKSRFVGKKFGVCLVKMDGHDFEVATFRKDGVYLDHRHPDAVTYGSMEDDAARRDFTVNALYQHPRTGEVRDLVGGLPDLDARKLRCVGDPFRRFNEDALRLLRAIRFATRYGFEFEAGTWQAMTELAPTIEYISPERHREELDRMLRGPAPSRALMLMDECGLLDFLLPEISAMKGVEQGRDYHPEGDVFQHTLLVMEKIQPRTSINVWAALLHDVGKPPTFERVDGRITFYEHQNVGADMARRILARLRFPGEVIDAVEAIVRRHMQFMNVEKMKPSTLRKFLSAHTIEHDLAVHRADSLGSWGSLAHYDFCLGKLREFEEHEEPVLPPPLVNGHDVMALGIPAGPRVGEALRLVQEKQLDGELVSREEALDWLRENHL
jgi:poly(A) polymerase